MKESRSPWNFKAGEGRVTCKPVCYWHMVTHLANQENYSPLPKLGLNDANYK